MPHSEVYVIAAVLVALAICSVEMFLAFHRGRTRLLGQEPFLLRMVVSDKGLSFTVQLEVSSMPRERLPAVLFAAHRALDRAAAEAEAAMNEKTMESARHAR
jgi:hypothetical protein